jgi:hypothetical protein
MRVVTFDEIEKVSGAGFCSLMISGLAGSVALGVAAGLTDGLALADSAGIWAGGVTVGGALSEVVC